MSSKFGFQIKRLRTNITKKSILFRCSSETVWKIEIDQSWVFVHSACRVVNNESVDDYLKRSVKVTLFHNLGSLKFYYLY